MAACAPRGKAAYRQGGLSSARHGGLSARSEKNAGVHLRILPCR